MIMCAGMSRRMNVVDDWLQLDGKGWGQVACDGFVFQFNNGGYLNIYLNFYYLFFINLSFGLAVSSF